MLLLNVFLKCNQWRSSVLCCLQKHELESYDSEQGEGLSPLSASEQDIGCTLLSMLTPNIGTGRKSWVAGLFNMDLTPRDAGLLYAKVKTEMWVCGNPNEVGKCVLEWVVEPLAASVSVSQSPKIQVWNYNLSVFSSERANIYSASPHPSELIGSVSAQTTHQSKPHHRK